jgi:glycosyltransferase involved in cell wall biosynthesis
MALYGDLTFDSRVRREAATLARAGLTVTIVCLANDSAAGDLPASVRVVVRRPSATSVVPGTPSPFFSGPTGRLASAVGRFRWLRDYIRNLRAWGRLAVTAAGSVDAWHLHDLTALAAVAPLLPRAFPVVYDAHELFLETGTASRLPRPARLLLRKYERRLVSGTVAVVTVNDGLAAVIRRRYRPRRIVVVHNCPDVWPLTGRRPTLIRDAAAIPQSCPVILYHGALSAHRGIEQLMDALTRPGLDNAHLVLLGFGEKRLDFVRDASDERRGGRVHVLDPVAPDELLDWVASADVAAMPIQPSTLNHSLSTPNKLFESLAAGVPVVASDFPAIRSIVLDPVLGPLGRVCDPADVDAVADALRAMCQLDLDAIAVLRSRCENAALERWNWAHESIGLLDLYHDVLGIRSA